jgi:hypothetical protein
MFGRRNKRDRPEWDERRAEALLGATVLVGVTRMLPRGPEHEQVFGEVSSADRVHGICIELSGSRAGEVCWLPPDLRGFAKARPGDYRLRSTGEIVTDPDYTATWTLHPPLH